MSLKPKTSQTPSEAVNQKDELHGPWGRINPEPQSVMTLRLCKNSSLSTEEWHSYPYRVLSSWLWHGGVGEGELRIEASSDLITVKGRGLDRLVEALDRNALEILREAPADNAVENENSIWVSSINVSSVRVLHENPG
jgi:hypothetical protein